MIASLNNTVDGIVCDDFEQLKNDPLIQDFASVDPEIYKLIKATNPTLRMFCDLAKRIVEV